MKSTVSYDGGDFTLQKSDIFIIFIFRKIVPCACQVSFAMSKEKKFAGRQGQAGNFCLCCVRAISCSFPSAIVGSVGAAAGLCRSGVYKYVMSTEMTAHVVAGLFGGWVKFKVLKGARECNDGFWRGKALPWILPLGVVAHMSSNGNVVRTVTTGYILHIVYEEGLEGHLQRKKRCRCQIYRRCHPGSQRSQQKGVASVVKKC